MSPSRPGPGFGEGDPLGTDTGDGPASMGEAEMGVPGIFPTPRGRMTGSALAVVMRVTARTASSSAAGVEASWGAGAGCEENRTLGARTA